MKVILFVLRLLWVVFAYLCYAVAIVIALIVCLVYWDLKCLRLITDIPYAAQDDPVKTGEKYWVYKTPFDYLIQRKTWETRTN